jgi:general secretion pathway protein L
VADTAFIRMTDAAGGAAWAVLDSAGHLLTPVGRGSLAAARDAVAGHRVTVLVPATEAMATQAVLPAAGQARLRQLAPYSLEDYVADDVEDLLFAVGPRFAAGATAVTVVARERLDTWLSDLRSAGIAPQAVCSEAEGVPDVPGTLCLMIEGERIYGRRAGQAPFAFEGLELTEALEVLGIVRTVAPTEEELEESPADPAPVDSHLLLYVDQVGHARFEAELAALAAADIRSEVKVVADGVFPHLASTLAQRPATNLLQGSYAPKANWVAYARPWRTAAGLALAVLLIGLVSRGAEYLSLRREAAALDDRVAAECSRVVSATRVSSCQTQVRALLGQKAATPGSTETFLSTLGAVAESRAEDLRIDALSYRNRVLDLQLVAANVSALDDFARMLQDTRRYAAKIESTSNTDKGVEGRVQVVGVNP